MKKLNEFKWIFFTARRFAAVDISGRTAITSRLASIEICLGVMTLIVVLSVMNGFQLSFIDAIMEVSSYHIQAQNVPDEFEEYCKTLREIRTVGAFYEAQGLVVGAGTREAAALIRAVSPDVRSIDNGFASEVLMTRGKFDLSADDSIVLGSSLANKLGVSVGNFVNILALSGGSDVELISDKRIFHVTGIFHTGYAAINSSYAFVGLGAGQEYFGADSVKCYGIKLHDSANDTLVIHKIKNYFPKARLESWRDYNRSFFGALRIEKNMMSLLVLLIFLVVCINIFNSLRRLVYERRTEISILSALGGQSGKIQLIFIAKGLLTGIHGSVPGLALGLLVCVRMESVFMFLSHALYAVQYFFAMLFSPEYAYLVQENPMYLLYARIPARVIPSEVLLITLSGIFSALMASWLASKGVLKVSIAEVLRSE